MARPAGSDPPASRDERPKRPSAGSFFGFEPLPPRGPVVTNELIDRLREPSREKGPE